MPTQNLSEQNLPDRYVDDFDEVFDVIVAGFGFAGGAAAIEAADLGGNVLLIEKAPIPGGISICAGGGIRITDKPKETFEYLRTTNAGTTFRPVFDDYGRVVAIFTYGWERAGARVTAAVPIKYGMELLEIQPVIR